MNFDLNNYVERKHWNDIKTPHFQNILEVQELSKEMQELLYVFIGSMFHIPNNNINLPKFLFIKGPSCTGKSTILDTLNMLINGYENCFLTKEGVSLCYNTMFLKSFDEKDTSNFSGIMAANVIPSWVLPKSDMFVIPFKKQIIPDPDFKKKLKSEITFLFYKCNIAYLEYKTFFV